MGLATNKLNRDNHTNLRQIAATLCISQLCIACGNFLGFTATATPSMKQDTGSFPNLSDHDISWIGSLGPLGALVGAIFTTFPIGRFGSRRTIGYFGGPSMLLSWVTITFSKSLYSIYIGRFLGGIAAGIIISCCPLYIIDISSINRRGRLGILPQFLMIFGILLSYVLGTFLEWRALAIACATLTAPFVFLLPLAPDSPKWLISRKRVDEAQEVLEKLHGSTEAYSSLQALITKIEQEKSFRQANTSITKPAFKSCAVVLGILSFQQLTGINGVTFYSVRIFQQSAGSASLGGHIPSIILAFVQCVASFTSSLVIERAGRKLLLQISSSLISLATLILGSYFYFEQCLLELGLFWVPLAALIFFSFAFAVGLGPITWILCAELLAEETRHKINPLAIAYYWFCVFIVTKSFPLLVLEIQIYGVFWLYAVVGALGFIFISFLVPETMGKTPTEIRAYFGYEDNNASKSVESLEDSDVSHDEA